MKKNARDLCFLYFLVILFFCFQNEAFSQNKEDDEKEIPQEQIPVQERDPGDSLIENIGELPGKIIAFPLNFLFKGAKFASAGHTKLNDWLTSEDGNRKVRPAFAPPSGGGLTFKQVNAFKHGMTFKLSANRGIRTRTWLSGSLKDPHLFSAKFGLQLAGFYHRKPDEDFFGLGNESLKSEQSNYLHEETNFEASLLSVPLSNTQFSLGFTYSDVNIQAGRDPNYPSLDSLFSEALVPGFFGAEMGSLHFKIYHDSRDVTGHPTKGGERSFSVEISRQINGNQFGFRKFTIDVRQYIELFYRRVLALRVRTEITDDVGDRAAPFYRLPGLGEPNVLSGYRPVRFRGNDLMLAGIEYRIPIHAFASFLFFFEEGRVFSNIFDEFSLKDWKYSFGGGLRLFGREGSFVTGIGMARSAEQTRLVFGLNVDLRSF